MTMNKTDIAAMYKDACKAYEREHARANDLQRKARAAAKAASDAKRTIDMIETLDPSIKSMVNNAPVSADAHDAHALAHVNAPSVPPVPQMQHAERITPDPATDEQLRAILEA